jgi:hypothetical protein
MFFNRKEGAPFHYSPFHYSPFTRESTNYKVQSTAKALLLVEARVAKVNVEFASQLNRQLQLSTQPQFNNFLKRRDAYFLEVVLDF